MTAGCKSEFISAALSTVTTTHSRSGILYGIILYLLRAAKLISPLNNKPFGDGRAPFFQFIKRSICAGVGGLNFIAARASRLFSPAVSEKRFSLIRFIGKCVSRMSGDRMPFSFRLKNDSNRFHFGAESPFRL